MEKLKTLITINNRGNWIWNIWEISNYIHNFSVTSCFKNQVYFKIIYFT